MAFRTFIGSQAVHDQSGITFSNVTCVDGDRLFLIVGTNDAVGPLQQIQADWGSFSLTSQGWGFAVGTGNSTFDGLASNLVDAGTHDVVLSFGPSTPDVAVAILVKVSGLNESFFQSDTATDQQVSGTSYSTPLSYTEVPEWFVGALLTVGPSSDTVPTLGGGFIGGVRLGTTFNGVSITVYEMYKNVSALGSSVFAASGFTNREFFCGTGGYPYPIPPITPHTGKLTYDYTFQTGMDREDIAPTSLESRGFVPRAVNFERRRPVKK